MASIPLNNGNDPRRRQERHPADAINCPLGQILDLSGTGMRVRVKGRCPIKEGQTVPLKLRTPVGSVSVRARVVWRKGFGWIGGTTLGFNFDGIQPAQSAALATIAKFGFIPAGAKFTNNAEADPGSASEPSESVDMDITPRAELVLEEYYQKLGVEPGASVSEIKTAFRNLARSCHPDVAPGPENQQRFVELHQAYDLLVSHLREAG